MKKSVFHLSGCDGGMKDHEWKIGDIFQKLLTQQASSLDQRGLAGWFMTIGKLSEAYSV